MASNTFPNISSYGAGSNIDPNHDAKVVLVEKPSLIDERCRRANVEPIVRNARAVTSTIPQIWEEQLCRVDRFGTRRNVPVVRVVQKGGYLAVQTADLTTCVALEVRDQERPADMQIKIDFHVSFPQIAHFVQFIAGGNWLKEQRE
jgi:hypothetical protein